MNFFGHAHVAIARTDAAPFVLGAMLPDFASMSGARLAPIEHPELAAGVALHHRTDDAFHTAPAFVRLCERWGGELDARGLSWGAARAVAHVGTEMLLDGFLLDDAPTRDAYLRALAAIEEPLRSSVRVSGAGAERFPAVLDRIRAHGLPDFYRDPIAVADRLIRILASRPRLAVEPHHRATLERAMLALQREVELSADALVTAARAAV